VRDQSGRPLPGAIVSAVGRRIVTSVTDEQGRCVFSALPPATTRARAPDRVRLDQQPARARRPGANTTWSFVLKTQSTRARRPAQRRSSPPTSSRPVSSATPRSSRPIRRRAEDESSHDHSEVAWRLKHLKRSVLKEATDHAIFDEDGDPEEFDRAVADLFTRQTGSVEVAASLLSNFPFAGQVNLLTTGAFDSPQQLVSAGSLARGVAMVSLGASAGSRGDWAVQGAMTQGDVASWMVSGSYLTAAPARHVLDVGMSYSLQRYDGSNPSALAAVSDVANRYAGMVLCDRLVVGERSRLAGVRRAVREVRLHRQVAAQPARAPDDRPADTVRVSVGVVTPRIGAWCGRVRAIDGRRHVVAAGAHVCAHQGAHLRARADTAS
jgi:hypothetical protein